MELVPSACEYAHQAQAFDNLVDCEFLVAVKRDGEMDLHNPAQHPDWG